MRRKRRTEEQREEERKGEKRRKKKKDRNIHDTKVRALRDRNGRGKEKKTRRQ
ncbi:hypothetical protein [Mycobacterium canetti]|uniref:hypothetical protein n=1 Tax=Mycobacterium canetti TaxID=78331 RepID=UPI001314716C|nr:hypothetical protein [Mycobacterium canetti]